MKATIVLKGGPGSGHFDHAGRPGKHGGSVPGRSVAESVVADSVKRESNDEKAAAHLNHGLDGGWNRCTDFARLGVKASIVDTLTSQSGMPKSDINDGIRQWAETSNDSDMRSLSLQEAASEEFGVNLSEWQHTTLSSVKNRAEEHRADYMTKYPKATVQSYLTPYPTNGPVNGWSRQQERKFLRTMYNNTQTQLRDAGFKPDDVITLYRGFSTDVKSSPGNVIDYTGNAMESWSISNDVATKFTGNGRGIVITSQVRVRDILSTARTGFGCLIEGECVVLGNSKGIQATVVQGNDAK